MSQVVRLDRHRGWMTVAGGKCGLPGGTPAEGGPLTQLPNVLFVPAVVFGPFWVFAPLLVGLFGFMYAVLHWREPAARFTVWLTLLTWAVLTVYVYQAARLAAPDAGRGVHV